MNKVYASKECYIPIREDKSRTIISYGYVAEEDGINATWYEVYFYKKKVSKPDLDMVRNAILADIDSQTDEKILTGFSWEDNDGVEVMVYLSRENQDNYKNAHDMAKEHPEKLPVTFKLSDIDYTPHFRVFQTYEELDAFYMAAYDFINATLEKGFRRKYTINWQDYRDALDALFPQQPVVESETPAE